MSRAKYTKEERMKIGRRIAEHELTSYSAAIEYDICLYTARDYLRMYKAAIRTKLSDNAGLRDMYQLLKEKKNANTTVLPHEVAQQDPEINEE